MASSLTLSGVVALLAGYLAYRYATRSNGRKLPPGPKPLPLIGNARDFPPPGVPEHQHWLKHKDKYGPVSSVTVFGMTLVLIHDQNAAQEILEKSAAKTSGRPTMVFANELCGYESIAICQGYNNNFRRYRKLLHKELGTKGSATKFRGVQEVEVRRQLMRTLNEPAKWLEHLKTSAGATILKTAYGYTVEPHKSDTLVTLSDKMRTEFSLAAAPMAWPVDIIPVLRYLPENFPGATFKKTARRWRKSIQSVAYMPYRFVQRQVAAGRHRESYVSRLVEQHKQEYGDLNAEDEKAIIWSAASLYGAASDTMIITLTAFTAAMILFPDVQRKAQEEIDRVVGADRLPSIEDRDNLPYVDAVVQESLRWWPIAPMGFPHTATGDLEYAGLHIPKGAYLLPNVWWFLHDPEVYADPDSFNPERFFTPRNEPDPSRHAWGYGRRMCPGRFFADTSLYLNIVQTLCTFNIKKAMGADGKEVEVDVKVKPGVLSYVTDFEFEMTPRSEEHAELIRRIETDHPWEEGDAHLLEAAAY